MIFPAGASGSLQANQALPGIAKVDRHRWRFRTLLATSSKGPFSEGFKSATFIAQEPTRTSSAIPPYLFIPLRPNVPGWARLGEPRTTSKPSPPSRPPRDNLRASASPRESILVYAFFNPRRTRRCALHDCHAFACLSIPLRLRVPECFGSGPDCFRRLGVSPSKFGPASIYGSASHALPQNLRLLRGPKCFGSGLGSFDQLRVTTSAPPRLRASPFWCMLSSIRGGLPLR
jgi:hypothetical protein